MNTKRHLSINRKLVMLGLASLVLVIGAGIGLLARNNSAAATKNKDSEPVSSMFTFIGADGWRQGPSNETSMVIFGEVANDGTSACFTSIEYKAGVIDANAEHQKDSEELVAGGYTVKPLETKMLSIETSSGKKQYPLYRSQVSSGTLVSDVMGGHGLGFLQLSKGYLKVFANCNTADQLDSTIDALQAYRVGTEK